MAEAVPSIVTEKGFLFTLLHFVLEGCKSGDVTEGGLLHAGLNLLDSLLGGLCFGVLAGGLHLFVSADVGNADAAGAAAEIHNLDIESLTYNCCLTVFLDHLTCKCGNLCSVCKGEGVVLVAGYGNGSLNFGTYGIFGLQFVPRVGSELLVTEGKLVAVLVEVKDDHVDNVTALNHL